LVSASAGPLSSVIVPTCESLLLALSGHAARHNNVGKWLSKLEIEFGEAKPPRSILRDWRYIRLNGCQ
jgi:hypothetical protein